MEKSKEKIAPEFLSSIHLIHSLSPARKTNAVGATYL